jgi:ferredoxin
MDRRAFLEKGAGFVILGGMGMMAFTADPSSGEKKYKVISQRCNGCGHCYRACRDKALQPVEGKAIIDINKCTGCGDCTRFCHRTAIVLNDKG